MLDELFAPALPKLQDAMGFEAARQRVLAHNLANINTPGYQAKDLFRAVLDDTLEGFANIDAKLKGAAVEPKPPYEIQTLDDPPLRADGNNVNLESQLVGLADVELRYRALSEMTTRYFRGLERVITGGR